LNVEAERVLVIPRAVVMSDPGWHGVRTDALAPFEALVARASRFVPRGEAETDRSLKQLIPYLVLRDGAQIFLMRRTRAGGDARLHERFSIGVGGHVNPGDGDLLGGLRREWREELEAAFVPEFRFVGLLNDDTTEVGAVHLGAVFVADAAGRSVGIRENDKLSGAFASRDEVAAVADRMETWSLLAFDFIERLAASGRSEPA
jgi:predicted NUDIX family phosphoesterase